MKMSTLCTTIKFSDAKRMFGRVRIFFAKFAWLIIATMLTQMTGTNGPRWNLDIRTVIDVDEYRCCCWTHEVFSRECQWFGRQTSYRYLIYFGGSKYFFVNFYYKDKPQNRNIWTIYRVWGKIGSTTEEA